MTVLGRRMVWGAAVLALFVGGRAVAQEDLDSGKSPAQLYASNCAICHKTPRGMSKAVGPLGLQPFLREHYTASRRAAAAIAAYVDSVDRGAPTPDREPKRAAKPKDVGKPDDGKASKAKAEPKSDAKGSEPAKQQDKAKASEPKPVEAKAEASQPASRPESKPAAPPAESKPDSDK